MLLAGAGAGASSLPDDIELEASGARIGRIEYRLEDVFDTSDPQESGAFYRIANRLHIQTRRPAIEAQLLFRSGDRYSRHVLEESERILRRSRYLVEAEIRPIRYQDNVVDVEVRTRDVWTLNPGVSFKMRGGENASRIELEDTNLLGQGKHLQFARSTNVDRDSWSIGWADPNVWGSRWQLDLGFAESDDGDRQEVRIEQPFYALDTRRGFGMQILRWDRAESRYALGEVAERFRYNEQRLDVYGGWSTGLREGWVRRWLTGYRIERRNFSPLPSGPAATQLPEDRRFAWPWIGFEWVQDDYREMSNLTQIGRTEDLAFGFRLRLDAGWSGESLGATRDSIMLGATLSDGFEPAPNHYLFIHAGLSARVEGGAARHAVSTLNTQYYIRTGRQGVFFASADVLNGHELDPEVQILLGGDNGLRGYPLRYQTGSGRALLTLEQRVYTDWYPFRLVRVGGAVFFDVGRTWGRGPLEAGNLRWLADAGVGLRLGMSRSGLGNVLHVDVAFPLERRAGIDSVQFQVETKRSF